MMDITRQPNLSNDQVNECQSFDSNHRPYSQPRKISIGILMDSSANTRPKNVNDNKSIVPTNEHVTPSKANSSEDGHRMDELLYTAKRKQTEDPEQETSPWLSTRSFHQKLPTTEQVHSAEPARILLASRSITETHNIIHVAKDITAEGIENLSLATTKNIVPEKQVVADKSTKEERSGRETLRMKLWEILGTISSPNRKHPNDYDLVMGAKNLKSFQKNYGGSNPVVKPIQNSDTIESDSECHDHPVRRPRTRSLTRKRVPDKLKATTVKNAQSTYFKKEIQEMNTSSFREGFSARLHYAASGGSLTFKRKKSQSCSPGIKARTMCSHEHRDPGQNHKVKSKGEKRASLEKSLSHGNGGEDDKELYQRRKTEFFEPKSVTLEIDSHQVQRKEMSEHLRNAIDSPKLQKNMDWQKDVSCMFDKNIPEQKFDIHSPTFGVNTPRERCSPDFLPKGMKTPAARSSPGSPPKDKPGKADDDSPAKMVFNTEGIRSFKGFLASKSASDKSNSQSNSSDDAGVIEDSPHSKPRPVVEQPESWLSKSSSKDSDSETSKEGSHVKGFRESEPIFPETGTVEKPVFVLNPKKKHHYQEAVEVSGFSPTLFSRKGVEDTSNFQQHLELNQGDGLARAVSLFALALERVKSKMKSVVIKRSAEILMSVAEGVHLQLKSAESQIQADMGKLTSLNISKRKRLEMRFQELQGELNVIHAKFKEEVRSHLQDCRYTVEGLDAHQMELRGTVEKQSASHRKLLLQAEEAIETQLNDAGRRITVVHNLAREKMLQLKYVVADCLNDGNFG